MGLKNIIKYCLNKRLIDRVFENYIEPYQEEARLLEISKTDSESLFKLFKRVAQSNDVARATDVLWTTTENIEAIDTIFSNAAHELEPGYLIRMAQVLKHSPVFKVIDQHTGWANDVRIILEDRMPEEDLVAYKKLNI